MTLPTHDDADDLLQANNWTNLPDDDPYDGLSYARGLNGGNLVVPV